MLEVKNLTKIYTPKKGIPVKALDNVSLTFEETGMVFVLGKSGSGKSTFLNMVGGLDTLSNGDVIIKGKSSADFSQSDFDSYRNTFIGFIFQEYNILNEFSVGKNIGLALELQGKRADKAAVDGILEQVDLAGYANRKPNELSGGQKQRVAIARALVKNPEIIMADEPTGALDSNTGKQVFETLQKLSKTKLVIIVSHDRDYAEFYGDRVIEFADGKVISDVKKYTAQSQVVGNGLSVVDGSILHVRKGHKFSETEKAEVIRFLENASGDMIVSKDEKANTDFRRLARIDAQGNKESFESTSEKNQKLKQYDPTQLTLIRSRLPVKDSLKIAGSSLKVKPIRLFLTVLLSAIAFGMFGIADTAAAYDKYTTMYNSMQESEINYAALTKSDSYRGDMNMTEADALALKTRFPQYQFDAVRSVDSMPGISLTYGENLYGYRNDPNSVGLFYTHGSWRGVGFSGILEIDEDAAGGTYRGFSVTGAFPKTYDEIMISRHVYEAFRDLGYLDAKTAKYDMDLEKHKKEINSESDLIGRSIVLGSKEVKIVGIIDTDFPNRYDNLKISAQNENLGIGSWLTQQEMRSVFEYSYHGAMYVKSGFYDNNTVGSKYHEFTGWEGSGQFFLVDESIHGGYMQYNMQFAASSSQIGKNGLTAYFADGRTTHTLAENEVLLSLSALVEIFGWDAVQKWETEFFANPLAAAEIEKMLLEAYDEDVFVEYISQYLLQTMGTRGSDGNFVPQFASLAEVIAYMESEQTYTDIWDNDLGHYVQVSAPTGSVEEYILRWEAEWGNGNINHHARVYATLEDAYLGTLNRLQGSASYYTPCGMHYQDAYNSVVPQFFMDKFFPSSKMFSMQGTFYSRYVPNIIVDSGSEHTGSSSDAVVTKGDGSFPYKIVGIAVDSAYNEFNTGCNIVFDDEWYERFASIETANIVTMIAVLSSQKSEQMELIRYSYEEYVYETMESGQKKTVRYRLQNSVSAILDGEINYMIEMFAQVFLYIGIGFAVFAAFLLMNFIIVSISYKKREIGVLRAIGARSRDVFMIFFLESLIIALISFVVGAVGCGVAVFVINGALRAEFGLLLTLLNFGIRQIALILGVSVGIAAVASFLPVYNTARKKPIEAIRTA